MSTKPARERRARGSIDPEVVLDGAFEIAARDGVDNLSMPALAAYLDVGVTSIYWHFQNKDGLLRRMSTRALHRVVEQQPSPEDRDPAQWREFLRELFVADRDIHRADRLLTEFTVMRTATHSRRGTLEAFQGLEGVIAYLVSAGFALFTAWQVWSTLSVYTRGFVMTEHNRELNQTPPPGLAQLNLLDAETMPTLFELISQNPGIFVDGTGDAAFEAGLDAILDAAERRLDAERASE